MTPEALAALHARAMVVPGPWSAVTISGFINGPGAILVTETAGFALGRVASDEAELLTLAVDPAHRRMGVGERCLAAFELEARNQGAARAFLEVAATNKAAHALYVKAGWQKDGLRKAYYRAKPSPIDAITMSKALNSA